MTNNKPFLNPIVGNIRIEVSALKLLQTPRPASPWGDFTKR